MNPFEKLAMEMNRMHEQEARPISMQQAAEQLKSNLSVLNTEHTFNVGDILQPKKGVESGHKTPRGGVVVFVSYTCFMDRTAMPTVGNAEYGSTFSAHEEDCVIGVLSPEGAMMLFVVDSRFYEPAVIVDQPDTVFVDVPTGPKH